MGRMEFREFKDRSFVGFVATVLLATLRESMSVICASATPTAAWAADQPTILSVPLALPALPVLTLQYY